MRKGRARREKWEERSRRRRFLLSAVNRAWLVFVLLAVATAAPLATSVGTAVVSAAPNIVGSERQSSSSQPSAFQPIEWRAVGPGVEHGVILTNGPVSAHAINVLRVARDNPNVSFVASLGRGQVEGIESVLAQALRLNTAAHEQGGAAHAVRVGGAVGGNVGGNRGRRAGFAVVGGINADFFASSPVSGLPIGLHLQDGEIVVSPKDRPVFAVLEDGRPIIGVPLLAGEVWRENVPPHAVDGTGTADELLVRAAVNDVNRPPNGIGLVVYTPRFGSETPAVEGTTVTLRGIVGPLQSGLVYSGVVARKEAGRGRTAVRAAIPADGVVLAARGPAEVLLEDLVPGEWVRLQLHLAEPFDRAAHAVAGWPILVQNGKPLPLNNADSLVSGRHPRTAVGFNERELFLVTVDGRQAGHADGMTLPELTDLMVALGATEAINLDGGGSTTFVVRPPGEERPVVANRPSDGHERGVANALFVVSTALPAPLATLHVLPAAPAVLVGGAMPIALRGQDVHNGPVAVEPAQVRWTVSGEGDVITIVDAGPAEAARAFVAHAPGTVRVTARIGTVETTVPIDVVTSVAKIELSPDTIHLGAGETVAPDVRAFDEAGRPVWVNAEQLTWRVVEPADRELDGAAGSAGVVGPAGAVEAAGHAMAAEDSGAVEAVVIVQHDGRITGVAAGRATVEARFGQAVGSVTVTVDRPPVLLSEFDDPDQWFANAVRAQAAFSVTGPPEPVHSGEGAGKLVYDLSVAPGGTAAAYVQATEPIPIPDRPRALGIWVYGDESGHWLRGNYLDGEGNRHVLDFTAVGGLDWTGWLFVEAPIPPDAVPPLTFERVYVVEMHRERQTRGVLYFDRLVALYGRP